VKVKSNGSAIWLWMGDGAEPLVLVLNHEPVQLRRPKRESGTPCLRGSWHAIAGVVRRAQVEGRQHQG
jgi:hypothetical protein